MSSKLEMQIKLDLKEVMAGLNAVNGKLNELFGVANETVTIDADTSGAVSGADEVEGAIDEVPDGKEVIFDSNSGDFIGELAKVGLAFDAITNAYQKITGKMGELISLSNTQELSVNSLTSALKVKGQATEQEINRLKDYASEIQKVTTVGDEQSIGLLTLATNMGIVQDKREEALRGSIGLAEAYAKAGLSQETAMKGIALAYEGDFNQLQRYIPALKTAKDETEKMAILQEAMANGFEMAQDKTKTGAGAMEQFSNQVGDLKEKLGDMLKSVLLPLVSVLNKTVTFMNEYPQLTKVVVIAIASVTAYITFLKTQQMALNAAQAIGAALSGNWIALAAAATIGVGAWALSSSLMADEQSNLNNIIEAGSDALKTYKDEISKLSIAELEASKKNNLSEIEWIDKYIEEKSKERENIIDARLRRIHDQDVAEAKAERDQLDTQNKAIDELLAKHYQEKKKKQQSYYDWKKEADYTASLDAINLAKYNLAQAEKEYASLSELDAESVEKKKEVYSKILQYKKQIADQESKEEQDTKQKSIALLIQEKMEMIKYYADISQLSTVSMEKMKEDFSEYFALVSETYGAESEEYKKTKDELAKIEKSANDKLIQEKENFISQVNDLAEDGTDKELSERNRLLQELKRHYAEGTAEYEKYLAIINQATIESAEKRYQDDVWPYDAQMQAVNDFFDKKHNALIESGMEEERIAQLRADALVKIEEEKNQRQLELASGFFGNMATVAEGFGKGGFSTWKRMAQAQAIVDTYASAVSAFKALSGIPIVGPALGTSAASAAIAYGLANVKKIEATKYQKAEFGAYIRGKSHSEGGEIIEVERGEYINRAQRVKELGVSFFRFINNAPLGQIKQTLSGFFMPNIPAPASAPQFAYASGGQVSSSGNSMMDSLISEVKLFRQELRDKKMSVINQISANDVMKYVDDDIVSEKAEKGDMVRSVVQ